MNEALDALMDTANAPGANWFTRLERVVDGRDVLATGHANGFWKVVLRRFSDGSKLRLHVWSHAHVGNAHDHRWDFNGAVLQGALLETCYTSVPENDGTEHQVYEVRSNQLFDTARVESLRATGTTLLVPGCMYWRRAGLVHSVVAHAPDTVSLVATERPRDDRHALVLCPKGRAPVAAAMTPRELSASEFLKVLKHRLDLQLGGGQR